jgi:hypothetical protein
MKTQLFRIAVITMALLAASVATAQGPSSRVLVNVPFAFVIDNHQMPAGRYVVTSANDGILLIYDTGVPRNHMFLPVHSMYSDTPKDAKLVFHRYGDSYFLAEVWNGSGTGKELFPSKAEKEIIAGRLNGSRPKAEVAVLRPER